MFFGHLHLSVASVKGRGMKQNNTSYERGRTKCCTLEKKEKKGDSRQRLMV